MKTIHLVQVNLRKSIISWSFLACIMLAFTLFITCSLYYDYNANCDVSIIRAFLIKNRSDMLQDTQFCTYNVLLNSISGWMKMFIPMIVSFPFVLFQCTEQITGFKRFSGIRISKQKYYTGTFLSSMLTGGLVMIVGFTLFCICIAFMFPNINEYELTTKESYEWWIYDAHPLFESLGYSYLILLRFLEVFLYGSVSAIPACFMMCFLKNKYLVISIPFFLKYLLLQHISRLRAEAYADYEKINEQLLVFIKIVDPDSVSQVFSGDKEIWKNVLFYTIILLLSYIFYCIIMNRRQDYSA